MELRPENVAEIIKESIEINLFHAKQKEMNLVFFEPDYCPELLIDRAKMLQVFMNLVSNAVKYSTNGDQIEMHVIPGDDEIVITVEDHGPGIPRDQLSRLFQVYERGNTSSVISGSGFGLAIAKKIVDGHGGNLHIESEENHGMTCYVHLPLQEGKK